MLATHASAAAARVTRRATTAAATTARVASTRRGSPALPSAATRPLTSTHRAMHTLLPAHAAAVTATAPASLTGTPARGIQRRRQPQLRRYLSADYGDAIVINMPALSPTMEHGKITKWHKASGDELFEGDSLCEIETDKATLDLNTTDAGFLAQILVAGGDDADVPVGYPVALMCEEESEIEGILAQGYTAQVPAAAAGDGDAAAAADAGTAEAPAASAAATPAHGGGEVGMMPAARHLIASLGLDASAIAGTGKHGMITKGDVLAFTKGGAAAVAQAASATAGAPAPAVASAAAAATPAASGVGASAEQRPGRTFTDIKPSNVRKVIASRLTESKAKVPHAYALMTCPADKLLAMRQELKAGGLKVSVNDLVIKAAALALRDVPEANSAWDLGAKRVVASDTVDISVAVATDGGLITPIVRDADRIGLTEVNSTVADLASRARAGKLAPDEYQGGSFTISNLGMFGINEFSAVINPPQACILAVGGSVRELVFPEDDETQEPVVQTNMTVQLSADRRVVDDFIAGQFLAAFRSYIANPFTMLV